MSFEGLDNNIVEMDTNDVERIQASTQPNPSLPASLLPPHTHTSFSTF
jgi:hypothetical protein